MARLNKSVVPQGMLAPSGYTDTPVNPAIQSTTRPAGVLTPPSPGFDSVRIGKNRFQGRGPSGGFRRMEFAEDVGGTGAALSVVPGKTSQIDASEWLDGSDPREGAVIIADREYTPALARRLHDAYATIPDMGDRHPSRPLSRAWWERLNPAHALREEYRQSPAVAVGMGAGLIYVVYLLAGEIERSWMGRSPRGLGTEASRPPASVAEGTGDAAAGTIDKIGEAGDKAVNAIESATEKAVNAIESAAESAKETVTGE